MDVKKDSEFFIRWQNVTVSQTKPDVLVTKSSGVPRGSVFVPLLFYLLILIVD